MEENRYEKALERAKSAIKECGNNLGRIKMIESIFPELAGDMDEQSRKWILEYLYDGLRKADEQFEGQFKAAIAYLEKVKDFDEHLEQAYKTADEVQYKRGYEYGREDYHAQALLHVLNKGVEQGKKEMLDRVIEWLDNSLCCYIGAQNFTIEHDRLNKDLRKAMEEQP